MTMKLIVAITATLVLTAGAATASAASGKTGCGPAIQNWLNGSKTTCPVADGTSGISPVPEGYPQHTICYPHEDKQPSTGE